MKEALLKLYYNLPYTPKAKTYSVKGAKNNRIPVSDTTLSFDRGNIIKFISKECYEYMFDNIKEYKKTTTCYRCNDRNRNKNHHQWTTSYRSSWIIWIRNKGYVYYK